MRGGTVAEHDLQAPRHRGHPAGLVTVGGVRGVGVDAHDLGGDHADAADLDEKEHELAALTAQLHADADSPQAHARAEETRQRLATQGRAPGWSLVLNPTPALLKEMGEGSTGPTKTGELVTAGVLAPGAAAGGQEVAPDVSAAPAMVSPDVSAARDAVRLAGLVLGQGHDHTAAPTSTRPGPEDLGKMFAAAGSTLRVAGVTARLVGGDGAEVARAARDTAGLLAAFAEHAPPADQRLLVAASAHLARAGQVAHGQPRGARSPLSTGFAQVAATVLTAASGGSASTAVLLAQVARLTRTVAELHAVQHRVAAARDTARAGDLLAAYAAPTARTPVAPTPVAVPPTPVLMPNQEQLDAMFGNTLEERQAKELRDLAQDYQLDEPGTYRAPPPTQERGRER